MQSSLVIFQLLIHALPFGKHLIPYEPLATKRYGKHCFLILGWIEPNFDAFNDLHCLLIPAVILKITKDIRISEEFGFSPIHPRPEGRGLLGLFDKSHVL
jgi:hypothetical protein